MSRLVCTAALICLVAHPAVAQRWGARNLRNSATVKRAFKDAVTAASESTVRVLVDGKPVALGCVVSPGGEVLTKATLVGDGKVTLRLPDGEVVPAKRGAADKEFDVLLLKAGEGEFKPMQFVDTEPGVGRLVASPGQDGSVLAVGMVTIETARAGLRRELAAVPPANSAFMGITMRPAREQGLVITSVSPNSPASKAGLTAGDTLLSIADTAVNSQAELQAVLRKLKPGDKASMKIAREGESKDGEITLGRRPQNQQGGADRWGGGPFSKRRAAFPKVITHDMYIRPSDCGGPVVTASGEVVGLNIARALRVATYAVPAGTVSGLITKLRASSPAVTAATPENKTEDRPERDTAGRLIRPTPLRAAGIHGSLMLYTENPSDDAFKRFLDLAKREQAQIVVVGAGEEPGPTVTRLRQFWTEGKGAALHRITVASEKHADDSERIAVIDDSTAVWIDGPVSASLLKDTRLAAAIESLQQRGGVVAGPAALLAETVVGTDQSTGAGLVPDSIVSTPGADPNVIAVARASNPLRVHYHLNDGASLVIRGRYIFGVGGQAEARFAKSPTWPDQNVTIEGRQLADLTALRRVARRRTGIVFPPKKPEPPQVDQGTLVIVGGGGMPEGLAERFVEEAGGKDAVIAVIPISMPASQLPERDRMAEYFKKLGAKEVHVLKQRTPEESDSAEVLNILRRTTGIWFGGGRQWRFIDAYEDTQAAQLMHDVLRRGGVIGGSSAGASIQGDYMARGNPLGPRNIMADGYETGLRFLKGVAIDQHFTQRNRLPDMTSLMNRYPQLLGIGIDETTALVVKKNIAEVVGRNRVCFYDRQKPVPEEGPDFEFVRQGGKYDLVARKVLDPGQPEEKPEEKPEDKPEEKPAGSP